MPDLIFHQVLDLTAAGLGPVPADGASYWFDHTIGVGTGERLVPDAVDVVHVTGDRRLEVIGTIATAIQVRNNGFLAWEGFIYLTYNQSAGA